MRYIYKQKETPIFYETATQFKKASTCKNISLNEKNSSWSCFSSYSIFWCAVDELKMRSSKANYTVFRYHQETLVALDTLVLDSFPEGKTVEEGVLVGHCHLVLTEVGLVAELLWEKEPDWMLIEVAVEQTGQAPEVPEKTMQINQWLWIWYWWEKDHNWTTFKTTILSLGSKLVNNN